MQSKNRCAFSNFRKKLAAGSLTVEAAWAVPLFFLCMVMLICCMDVYGSCAAQIVKLQQTAEKAALAAGLTGQTEPAVIDIRVPVVYHPKGLPGAWPGIRAACRGRARVWSGRDLESEAGSTDGEEDALVYVTENQSVYHTDARCTHLSLCVEAVASSRVGIMRNEDGNRFHACDKCVGTGERNAVVYISRAGDCYHNSEDCGGLTRNVRLVPASEVSGLHVCSRCGSGGGTES